MLLGIEVCLPHTNSLRYVHSYSMIMWKSFHRSNIRPLRVAHLPSSKIHFSQVPPWAKLHTPRQGQTTKAAPVIFWAKPAEIHRLRQSTGGWAMLSHPLSRQGWKITHIWNHHHWWLFHWWLLRKDLRTSNCARVTRCQKDIRKPKIPWKYFWCGHYWQLCHLFWTDSSLSWWTNTVHSGSAWHVKIGHPKMVAWLNTQHQSNPSLPVLNLDTYSNTASRVMKLSKSISLLLLPLCYPYIIIPMALYPPCIDIWNGTTWSTFQIFRAGGLNGKNQGNSGGIFQHTKFDYRRVCKNQFFRFGCRKKTDDNHGFMLPSSSKLPFSTGKTS